MSDAIRHTSVHRIRGKVVEVSTYEPSGKIRLAVDVTPLGSVHEVHMTVEETEALAQSLIRMVGFIKALDHG